MAKQAPEITVTNNPHAFIQCGPVATEEYDDKRDLTIVTSGGAQCVYAKSGNKTEVIPGASGEICGGNLDPSQKEAIAKAIVAPTGDIIILAENGNIRFRVRIFTSKQKEHQQMMVKMVTSSPREMGK